MTTTTYHGPGGQKVRQNQDAGTHHIVIEKKETDYVQKCGCNSQDNYTSDSWSDDLESLVNSIKNWAYYPDLLTFEVK